jgi:hypothetical protein
MFHVTYDLVTYESAEDGDTAENGFVHANGGRDQVEVVEDAADYAMSLSEALRVIGMGVYDCGSWFASIDSENDYRTGESTTYGLHPPANVTRASYARLKRVLGA